MDIINKYEAIKYGGMASRGHIEELDPTNALHLEAINRFNQLMRLPLTSAIRTADGRILCKGGNHNIIQETYFPEFGQGRHKTIDYGFVHDKGYWLTRSEAAAFAEHKGSYPLSRDNFMSGEEWLPPLKTEEDALRLAGRMHLRGWEQAQQRRGVFNAKGKHQDYISLLEIAIKNYLNSEERARNGN